MKFFLITTNHLTDRLLFRDEEDFKQGMNYVPVAALSVGVIVLAFILMSNHVHFVIQCDNEMEAKVFIDRFKRLFGAYYCRKYNVDDFLRRLDVDIRELYVHDESLLRGIAYVQCNSVAANITPHAALYEWGTGASFFREKSRSGYLLSDLSGREQCQLLRTRRQLPQYYLVSDAGFILPESYVPVPFVQSLFRTSNRYSYFLDNSSKARLRMEKDAAPSFRDQVIVAAIPDLCRSLFRVKSADSLSDEDLSIFLKQLRRRFSSDVKQLARVTGISYERVSLLLENF